MHVVELMMAIIVIFLYLKYIITLIPPIAQTHVTEIQNQRLFGFVTTTITTSIEVRFSW